MISTSGILSTGLKKCRPMKSAGRSMPVASSVIGRVEVLEHSSASASTYGATSAKTFALSVGSSKTASITRSQPARSSGEAVGVIRPSSSAAFSSVSLPRSTPLALSFSV